MRKVAEVAGVSAMTVSRALKDSPRVTAELRRKIRKIADRLGYRPDPEVIKLMTHMRRRDKARLTGGLAAVTDIPEELDPPQMLKVRASARARAEELGYRLEFFRIRESEKPQPALQRMLVARGIEGVLLLQMEKPVVLDRMLDWERFAVAATTPSVLAPEFPRVEANYFFNARLLCEKVAATAAEQAARRSKVLSSRRTSLCSALEVNIR